MDTSENSKKSSSRLSKGFKWLVLGTFGGIFVVGVVAWFAIPYVTKTVIEGSKIILPMTSQEQTKTTPLAETKITRNDGASPGKSAKQSTNETAAPKPESHPIEQQNQPSKDTQVAQSSWSLPDIKLLAFTIKSKLAKQGYLVDYDVHDVSRDGIDLFPTITLKNVHIQDPQSGIVTRADTAIITPFVSLNTVRLNMTLHAITLRKTVKGKSAIVTMDKATATVSTPWQSWLENTPVLLPVITMEKQFFNAHLSLDTPQLKQGNYPLKNPEKIFDTAHARVLVHARDLKSIGDILWQGAVVPAKNQWINQDGFMEVATLTLTKADTSVNFKGKIRLQKRGVGDGYLTIKNFDSFVNFLVSKRLVTQTMQVALRMGALVLGGEPKGDTVVFPAYSDGETLTLGTLKINLKQTYEKINKRIARP